MQLHELNLHHFENCRIWELSSDGLVTSTKLESCPTPIGGAPIYIAEMRFKLSDGAELYGYSSPSDDGIDYTQPVIIYNGVHVELWSEEAGRETEKSEVASKLGREIEKVFPLTFTSTVMCEGLTLSGRVGAT